MTPGEPPDQPDYQAAIVSEMETRSDWAALLRWWMGRDYTPARERALALLRDAPSRQGADLGAVALWIEIVPEVALEPVALTSEFSGSALSLDEEATLWILAYRPVAALCLKERQPPTEDSDSLFARGIVASRQILTWAREVNHAPLQAYYTSLIAFGCLARGDGVGAVSAFEETVLVRRELAAWKPEIFHEGLARHLFRLGCALSDLGQFEKARASYEEALAIYRELAATKPDEYQPAVAWTLNDLGNTQRALGDLQASLTSYGEAVAIRRELAMANPAAYRPDVATSLAKLGIVQRNLDQLELARASYQESQTIYRELALTKPDLYRPALAGALVWLGDVQWALNMPEAAQVKFENALTIFREMDEVKPGVFGPLWRIR